MTYNERVQALAEKMAHTAFFDTEFSEGLDPELWEDDKLHWINMHLAIARIAVAEMAEAITEALSDLLPTEGEDYKPGDNIYVINGYLYSNGLIPDEGLEADTDEKK